MGNNNRKVNCHNCFLDSYEVIVESKDTMTYLCRLCNAMEVVVCIEGMASVRYKSIRTKIDVDNKWN